MKQKRRDNSRATTTLVTILTILIFMPLVAADDVGCCVPTTQEGGLLCMDSAETAITEEVCDDIAGVWTAGVTCNSLQACTRVCCCDQDGGGTEAHQNPCISQGGTTQTFSEGQCSAVCSGSITVPTVQYNISGIVRTSDDVPTVATISLVSGTDQLTTNQSNDQGAFQFSNLSVAQYTITASTDECQSLPQTITLNRSMNVDLQLSVCYEPLPPCTPQQWQCEWSNEENECGYASECVGLIADNACDYPLAPFYRPCPAGDGCNNNNIAEVALGEQCDGTDIRDQTCQLRGFGSGNLLCSDTCTWDTTQCSVCSNEPNPSSCTSEQCEQCENCQDNLELCPQPTCEDYTPSISNTLIPQTNGTRITFTYPSNTCRDSVTGALIERCESDNGQTCASEAYNTSYQNAAAWHQHTYEDYGLLPSTQSQLQSYCYRVHTEINLGFGIPITTSTDWACVTTGNEECMRPHATEQCTSTTHIFQGQPGELIGPNLRAYCDDRNRLTLLTPQQAVTPAQGPYDCQEDACYGPNTDGRTKCGQERICQMCNSLYESYSYYSLIRVPVQTAQGEQTLSCNNFLVREFCYEEQTITTTDKDKTCSNIRSCYDYEEQNTCTQNACDINGLACEWNSLAGALGEQTGLGVCRSEEAQLHECARCEEDDHLSPACTASLCSIYGSSCYYTTGREGPPYDEAGRCMSTKDLGCSVYTTQETCTGTPTLDIDTQYECVGADCTRTGTTNEILIRSNDTYGFGTCAWDEDTSTCLKDADGNYEEYKGLYDGAIIDDCQPSEYGLRCYRDHLPPVTSLVLKEGNPPVYGQHEGLHFSYAVSDNEFTTGHQTKFSLTPAQPYWAALTTFPAPQGTSREGGMLAGNEACSSLGGTCNATYCYAYQDGEWNCFSLDGLSCDLTISASWFEQESSGGIQVPGKGSFNPPPQQSLPAHLQQLINTGQLYEYVNNGAWRVGCTAPAENTYPDKTYQELRAQALSTATFNLAFYSEDPSKNLEVVKTTELQVDATPPLMTNYEELHDVIQYSEDDFRTTLTISFDLLEENSSSSCDVSLTPIGYTDEELSRVITFTGTSYERSYPDLVDANYRFNATCADTFGNTARYSRIILVEADQSITNPQPRFEVFNTTTINITIQTANSATCYYSRTSSSPLDEQDRNLRVFAKSSDGLNHTKTLTELAEDEVYVYFTGCEFDEPLGGSTQGNFGDLIIFSIDTLPPVTTLMDLDTSQPFDPEGIYANQRTLTVACNDNDARLALGDESLSFGVKNYQYCLTQSPMDECPSYIAMNPGQTISIAYQPNTPTPQFINYRCEDNGGNIADQESAELLIRDTVFRVPQVAVCDPVTGECEWVN